MKHHLTCQSVDSSASNISYHYDMVWENFSLATSGFRLRPEAGRFVRLFSIPCLVLWFQYLRDFFIIVICVWLSISWIYWLEDNRIFISAPLLFFLFLLIKWNIWLVFRFISTKLKWPFRFHSRSAKLKGKSPGKNTLHVLVEHLLEKWKE